jgi:hypothetical protein
MNSMANVNGIGITLAHGERLITYKSKVSGDILYSTNKYRNKFIDSREFIHILSEPYEGQRVTVLVNRDSLEKIFDI